MPRPDGYTAPSTVRWLALLVQFVRDRLFDTDQEPERGRACLNRPEIAGEQPTQLISAKITRREPHTGLPGARKTPALASLPPVLAPTLYRLPPTQKNGPVCPGIRWLRSSTSSIDCGGHIGRFPRGRTRLSF